MIEVLVWYVIYAQDVVNSLDRRKSARAQHLARLQTLADAGRLLLAGPLPTVDNEDPGSAGFVGSLIVAKFSDLAEAKAWVAADPYQAAGVYLNVSVQPFKPVLP